MTIQEALEIKDKVDMFAKKAEELDKSIEEIKDYAVEAEIKGNIPKAKEYRDAVGKAVDLKDWFVKESENLQKQIDEAIRAVRFEDTATEG